MKKIFVLIIIITILLSACQPTPENPVVVNKANGELEKKMQQTATPTLVTEVEATPVPMEKVYRIFKAKDEKVQITVDAEVIMPDGYNLPVVVIEPDEISLEFVRKAVEVLLEGKSIYEPRTQLTKAEIEEKILELQLALSNPEESHSDGLRSGDPKIIAEVTEMFEKRIKIYQELYDNAPDDYMPTAAVLEFKPSKYYENEQRYKERIARWSNDNDKQAKDLLKQYEDEHKIVLDANLDGGYYGRLIASNFVGELSRWSTLSFIKSKTINENTFAPNFDYRDTTPATITQEQAKEKMGKLISDLGLSDMVMTYFYQSDYQEWDENGNPIGEKEIVGYSGYFQREYREIATLSNIRMSNTANEEYYRPRFIRESIEIRIYEDEIVGFNWNNPVKEVKIENDNVMTMPFDEIMRIFEQQMSLIYNIEKLSRDAPENKRHEEFINSIEKGYINITKIMLGMERIPIANDMNKYRMIPVWRFYGNERLKIKGNDNEFSNMPMEEFAYLTINAIDGSIVDFQSGY